MCLRAIQILKLPTTIYLLLVSMGSRSRSRLVRLFRQGDARASGAVKDLQSSNV
jgi:hypothetical protein